MVLILSSSCRGCEGYVYWVYEEGEIQPRSLQGCPTENCNEVHELVPREVSLEELHESEITDKIIGWEPGE